jgi:hypothetical protein
MAPNQPHQPWQWGVVLLAIWLRHFHLDAFFKSKQVQGRVGGHAHRALDTSLATFGQQTPPVHDTAPNHSPANAPFYYH